MTSVWTIYDDRGIETTALLSGTLKTYQRAACVEESMTLKCPPGTTISVALAKYGRTSANGIGRCGSGDPPVLSADKMNETCIWEQSLQVCVMKASFMSLI